VRERRLEARDHRGDLGVGTLANELQLVMLVELLEDVSLELAILAGNESRCERAARRRRSAVPNRS